MPISHDSWDVEKFAFLHGQLANHFVQCFVLACKSELMLLLGTQIAYPRLPDFGVGNGEILLSVFT